MKDERQKQISNKSWAIAGIFLMLCIGFVALKKFFISGTLSWEFTALFGAIIIISFSKRLFGDVEQPKSILGKDLPVGNSKKDRNARKINYVIDSIIFALIMTIMDIFPIILGRESLADSSLIILPISNFGNEVSMVINIIISIVVDFIIFYIIDYFETEKHTIKKYNDMLEKLEED